MELYFDKDRLLNLVKVDDGKGNLYIFNIPLDVKLSLRSILKFGELVSFKENDDQFRRMDSRKDTYSRRYSNLEPFVFTGHQEEAGLLAQRKKDAPVPGKETRRSRPRSPPHEDIDLSTEAPKPVDQPEAELFRGRPVLRDRKGYPYTPAEKICIQCGGSIVGKSPISELDGNFTRFQQFRCDEKAAPKAQGSRDWICETCLTVQKSAQAPAVAASPAPIQASEEIRGFAYNRFEKRDGAFWHKGNQIVKDGAVYAVFREIPCVSCGKAIKFRAGVSFRDGLPWSVAGNISVGQKAATEGHRSQKWRCEACLKGKAPSAITPEEVRLSDVVLAARAAGAEVHVELHPETENGALPTSSAVLAQETAPDRQVGQPEGASPSPLFIVRGNPVALLESMALDPSIDDKMFRGAAWMLARALGGKV